MSVAAAVWDALEDGPAEYRTPEVRPSFDEAKAWCRRLASSHYENLHVATFFLPKKVKPHFESIYAYCRVSDDLGDEVADTDDGDAPAEHVGCDADRVLRGSGAVAASSFCCAAHATIAAAEIPQELFARLLRAFRQDQFKTHFASMDELMAYSEDSANPVGRLVLWVSGYRDEATALLSDKVCTALQLANFWQDVVEDDQRGRRYLPGDLMQEFSVTDEQIHRRVFNPEFWRLMQSLVEMTRGMLCEGEAIIGKVDPELAATLSLFCKGGHAILDAIEAQGFDVLKQRPEVSKGRKARLLAGAVLGKLRGVYA